MTVTRNWSDFDSSTIQGGSPALADDMDNYVLSNLNWLYDRAITPIVCRLAANVLAASGNNIAFGTSFNITLEANTAVIGFAALWGFPQSDPSGATGGSAPNASGQERIEWNTTFVKGGNTGRINQLILLNTNQPTAAAAELFHISNDSRSIRKSGGQQLTHTAYMENILAPGTWNITPRIRNQLGVNLTLESGSALIFQLIQVPILRGDTTVLG